MDRIDRNGEADARVLADAARDRRIHADHATLRIEERAPGVAGIDRRVHLDHALNLTKLLRTADRTIQIAHDSLRHRAFESEGVADRVDRLTDEQARGVAELDGEERVGGRVDL